MKAVILAGGLGTRLSEEAYDKPKPMVEMVANLSWVYYENLCISWYKRFYNLLWLKVTILKNIFITMPFHNPYLNLNYQRMILNYQITAQRTGL